MTAEPEAALTVAAVARRLGVAPATLRTWDRRYGLGPSEHSAGAHRRYSPEDVARLMTMRRLTLEGVAPSEAARSALASGTPVTGPSEADVLDAYADVEMPADPEALVRAARAADTAAVRWLLARVHPRDTLAWYADLVGPAIVALTAEPTFETAGDSACHRLEGAAYAELRSRTAAQVARSGEREALPRALVVPVGAATDLEAHVLTGALAPLGVPAAVLTGGDADALADAVHGAEVGAVVVLVGAAEPPLAVELVTQLGARDADLTVFWHRRGRGVAPSGAHHVRSLGGACHEVVAVAG
ncbi:MerR family transcriptional regulator [Actinotalea sp. M2MS4P-6]|uniref:MerR family transcriptional regulator n=1 Tax=Actinotalea sp. M2MS4P-6 TaxID=2983762 RepID=UPI0021E48AD2|nr:MerR family transcriptional regulator [Actinotalea sp. M2MS4P-6]MCV2395507.1 MerR family transcriptional regulator [Actinotalea sp. M2MS4P-6]